MTSGLLDARGIPFPAATALAGVRHDDVQQPELDKVVGGYADARMGYVKNLLARSAAAGSGNQLNAEIIRKMRRHPTVASCLLVQSLPLLRADWTIECDDPKIAEALTAYYRLVAFTVHRTMARAMPDGYSPNELVWGYLDDVKLIAPYEVRDLAARTCTPAVDDRGTFDGFEQNVNGRTETFDQIYSLWITEGYAEGNYYGRSILDAAQEPWTDYAAIRAFHGRYLERFGEPVVLCRAPAGHSIENLVAIQTVVTANEAAGLSPTDPGYQQPPAPKLIANMDAVMEVGQNLRNHSVVALPSSLLYTGDGKNTGYAWNLEFLSAEKGGGTDFVEALREKKKDIATAMFVPDLLIGNGSDTGGSVANALGDTHRGVWEGATEGRLDDYSRQITEQLLDPVRLINYGAKSKPAKLVFAPLTDEEKDREWALVVALAQTGDLPIDVAELVKRSGLPLDENPEPKPAPTPPAADAPPAAPDLAHTHPVHALALPDWQQPQAAATGGWFRDLNKREQRVGFAAVERGLNDAEATALRTLEEILDAEHDRIMRQLGGVIRKGTPAEILAAIGTLDVKAVPKVSAAWSELMGAVGELAVARLHGELAAYAAQLPENVSPTARAMFKAYAATSAERAVTSLVTETRLRLLNAYTSGVVSKPGLAAVVGQVFDEYQSSEAKPTRLTTRMLSAKALNYSRASVVEASGIPLAGAQYSAILDHVTCELCRKLDETVIAIEHTDLNRFTPPVHHNCRCVWVWITRDEADFTPTWSSPAKSLVDRFGGLVVG